MTSESAQLGDRALGRRRAAQSAGRGPFGERDLGGAGNCVRGVTDIRRGIREGRRRGRARTQGIGRTGHASGADLQRVARRRRKRVIG